MATLARTDHVKQSPFRDWWVRTSTSRNIYLYLTPALLIMGIITFYPMLYQVWMSFTDYGIANIRFDAPPPNFLGLKNYLDIFTGRLAATVPNFDFWYLLGFNIWWAISNTVVHVSLGVLIAVLLNQKGLWFKGIYRAIYVLPIILPTLVIATVWRNLYDPTSGAINIFLGWPFQTIVATGALQSIPADLYEAAEIDGATPVQKFFRITVPLLRPAMAPATVYGLVTTFNLFNLIYFTSGGGPLRSTEIMVSSAFRLVNGNRLYGMAASFCVLIFFVLMAMTLLTNRFTRATEAYDV